MARRNAKTPAASSHLSTKVGSGRREAFIREYLIDENATQAAIRAGYSPNLSRTILERLPDRGALLDDPAVRRRRRAGFDRAVDPVRIQQVAHRLDALEKAGIGNARLVEGIGRGVGRKRGVTGAGTKAEAKLAKTELKMGETVRLDAVIRNKTQTGQPMTLARLRKPLSTSIFLPVGSCTG